MRLAARATTSRRKVGDTTYTLYTDGSYRHQPPKLRGHAAVKAAKRVRQYDAHGKRVVNDEDTRTP